MTSPNGISSQSAFGTPIIFGGFTYYDQTHSNSFTIENTTRMSVNVSLQQNEERPAYSSEITSYQFTTEINP